MIKMIATDLDGTLLNDEKNISKFALWNKNELDWIGPQNRCFIFNDKHREPNGFSDWIKNNFDRLDEWSKDCYKT
jgi:hypothetical protein